MTEAELLESKILLIDDTDANLALLERLLDKEGFTQVLSTTDSTKALQLVSAYQPDIILLDLMMPNLDGYGVLEQLKKRSSPTDYLPVIVITADNNIDAKRRALALGAKDFLTKPFDPIETMLRVWNLLETRLLYKKLIASNIAVIPVNKTFS